MGLDAMIFVFWMLGFKRDFHSLLSPSWPGLDKEKRAAMSICLKGLSPCEYHKGFHFSGLLTPKISPTSRRKGPWGKQKVFSDRSRRGECLGEVKCFLLAVGRSQIPSPISLPWAWDSPQKFWRSRSNTSLDCPGSEVWPRSQPGFPVQPRSKIMASTGYASKGGPWLGASWTTATSPGSLHPLWHLHSRPRPLKQTAPWTPPS